MQEIKDSFEKIYENISSLQARLTLSEVEDRKKFMYIQDSMFSLKKTLEELIEKLEDKNE